MAIDQRNISSQLRMMDDRALQQYASMHKSDPYIFPLAFQESQNRQKLRMSGQAKAAGQEMPKVNDAALMAMAPQDALPEEQGIGRLPAPNMQRMADGGIAGYGDDEEQGMATGGMGGMFNFAQQSEPVIRMSGGGSTRFTPGGVAYPARFATPDIDSYGQDSGVDEFTNIDDQIQKNIENQKMLGAFDDYSAYTPKPKKGSKAAKKLEEEAKKEAKKEEPAKPKVELPPLQTYTASTPEDIRKTADTMAKPDLEEIQASYKPFAEQFAQDRSRIESREKTNLSDALIRGGLKALGGKSPYAMQNISEGGLETLNAYQEGIRTSDAARKALTQSEMLMAQAQRAERQGARKDAVQLTHQAEQAKQTGVQLSNTARQIMGTEAFQQAQTEHFERADKSGALSAEAQMVAARAAQTRANALGANAGTKGALTEAQLARVRDTARDNVTKDTNFMLNQLKAEAAAKKAGKPFDAATWQASLVDAEVERLLANTSRGAKIPTPEAAPTGGKLGSGTYNPELWKNLQVVTPK
jgi:hypothetical protein